MAGRGTREDTFRVTLTVDGRDYGVWDKKTGGSADSNNTVYHPGGMAPQKSLGGQPIYDVLTLERLYELERDHDNLPGLLAAAGHGKAVAKQLPLDVNGQAYGRPIVYIGLLKKVQPPSHDSTSTNPAMLAVEISLDGPITA